MTKTVSPGDFDPRDPPRLDRAVRDGRPAPAAIRDAFPRAPDVLRGLALLWHDHWNEAHEIAQSDEGERDHDLLHYFVHRREGDFGNAGYWLRDVEGHPCFARLAQRTEELIATDPRRRELIAGGSWSARGFLEAVRREAKTGGTDGGDALLRRLQAEEFIAFAEWLGEAR